MRGRDESSGNLFSCVGLEARAPADQPLRAIRELTNAALSEMSGKFEALYSRMGRPGIALEKLLRTLFLQAFLLDPVGALVDGAARVQRAVPLVCGVENRRPCVARDDVHEELGASSGGGGGVALSGASGLAARGEAPSVEGSLLGGRDADRGVGVDQELQGGR